MQYSVVRKSMVFFSSLGQAPQSVLREPYLGAWFNFLGGMFCGAIERKITKRGLVVKRSVELMVEYLSRPTNRIARQLELLHSGFGAWAKLCANRSCCRKHRWC